MKKVEAFIRHEAFEPIRTELLDKGFPSLSISEVKGSGRQKGIVETYRGSSLTVNVRPKLKIEVVIEDKDKSLVVETILKHARTGDVGDGKIFVIPVEEAIRIRTGEEGEEVLQAHAETEAAASVRAVTAAGCESRRARAPALAPARSDRDANARSPLANALGAARRRGAPGDRGAGGRGGRRAGRDRAAGAGASRGRRRDDVALDRARRGDQREPDAATASGLTAAGIEVAAEVEASGEVIGLAVALGGDRQRRRPAPARRPRRDPAHGGARGGRRGRRLERARRAGRGRARQPARGPSRRQRPTRPRP